MLLNANGHESWIGFVESQHWEPGNLDQASYVTFLRAGSLGISPEEAISGVAARIRTAGDHPKMSKLSQQLRRAYSFARGGQGEQLGGPGGQAAPFKSLPKLAPAWPAPDLAAIERIVSNGPWLYDLWQQSSVRFEDGDSHAEEIIDTLFPGNPLVCVGKSIDQFATRRREIWRGRLASLPLIVPNPMLKVVGQTQDGRQSQHTKEATAERVYLVIEFDFAERDKNENNTIWTESIRKWRINNIEIIDACSALIFYLQRQLPALVCVAHSGSKSLHSWFRVLDKLSFSQQRQFMNLAVSLGADRATWLESQFVRIPDGQRDNGRRQTCYFLDPAEAVRA
jgi:hypothetical protein